MGVALYLLEGELTERKLNEEERIHYRSAFRGIGLYREDIPVETEICNLCNNHCRIRIATVMGEKVAYGFLCGRDYDVKRYVNRNRSGFDLLRERRRIFKLPEDITPPAYAGGITVGIPASLHLFDEIPLWRYFFEKLGIKTITSETFTDAVKVGKSLAGAEFCAPMSAMHGHVKYLAERADYIFLPYYLESRVKPKDTNRYYCYYTQYSPALA